MSAEKTPAQPPDPSPESPRYFALLYCTPARREVLRTLMALTDELATGLARHLDHSIAHVRLEWWRQEAERNANGLPQHPWLRLLREHHTPMSLDLTALVWAAARDLAAATLQASAPGELAQSLFEQSAELLIPEPPAPPVRAALGALGRATWTLEHASREPQDIAAPLAAQSSALAQLPSVAQAPYAPLLVWATLARSQSLRRARHKQSRWDGFADNIRAWGCARRAARGHFVFE